MQPGFPSLFSRSRYRGGTARLGALEPNSKEYQRVHEERERFAAATIAFCLHHDDAFLWHFWRKVCSKPQEHKPRTKPTVEIEPQRWSDLLLRWDNVLCAVEIKIGAPLVDHQNPGKEAFSRPGGYGNFLSRSCRERECKGRYVVFGWDQKFMPLRNSSVLGLVVEQRTWKELESGLPSSSLTADLSALLSSFSVAEFTFRLMKNKKLSGKLGDFGNAVEILESVRDQLGWPKSFSVTARRPELGIYLRATTKRKAIEGLAKRLKRENHVPEHTDVAWFGYLAWQGEPARRCVYAYCAKGRRGRLVRRLKTAKFEVDERPGSERDGEDGPFCAIVREGNDALDDLTWFSRALEAAGGAEPKKG